MAYQVNYTNPAKATITVPDGQDVVENATSISFVGKGKINYGEIVQENLLHIMENFASPTPPPYPTEGQFWFDSGTRAISVFKVPGEGAPNYGWRTITLAEDSSAAAINSLKMAMAIS